MALAARGARDLGAGTEPIADAGLAAALRGRARGVWMRTGLAVVLAAAALAVLG